MISSNTQLQLANVIMAIATEERSVERIRQTLARIPSFSPYSAFLRIDRNKHRLIDVNDLKKFMK